MAVTGFGPVYRNLKATLDYADNPDKTTLPEYLDEDLYAALRYAENDNKTDRQVFVCGINCSKQNAYAEMIAVQRRFGLRGKVVGYHGIQSFREGEVTPEQAFEIGKKTHRDYLREDVEYCLSFATNPGEFESQLYALGYTLDPVRFSVKAKHWERSVRLANIGFTKERVNKQLRQNAENRYRLFTLEYKPPYRPKRFPLEDELRRLDFAIDHSYDAAAVLVDTVFYLVITVIRIVAELADVMLLSPDLRAAEKDLKELIADYHFLQEQDIHTVSDLQANIEQSRSELSAFVKRQ